MTQEDIIRMAREAGLYFKDDDMICEWLNELRCFAELVRAAERNKVAAWMIAQGFATGHGDTMEGLLKELEWQVRKSEREACAKLAWTTPEPDDEYVPLRMAISDAIRARGQA
jgi:hypothetical protein